TTRRLDRHSLGSGTYGDHPGRRGGHYSLRGGHSAAPRAHAGILGRAHADFARRFESDGGHALAQPSLLPHPSGAHWHTRPSAQPWPVRAYSYARSWFRGGRPRTSRQGGRASTLAARSFRAVGNLSFAAAFAHRHRPRAGGLRRGGTSGVGHNSRSTM